MSAISAAVMIGDPNLELQQIKKGKEWLAVTSSSYLTSLNNTTKKHDQVQLKR